MLVAKRFSTICSLLLLLPPLAGRRILDVAQQSASRAEPPVGRSLKPSQASPCLAIVGAQSVQCSERSMSNKGFDGNKQFKGRKRQLAVDTGGRLLATNIEPANNNYQTDSRAVLEKLRHQSFNRFQLVLTDMSYNSRPLADWVQNQCCRLLETGPSLSGSSGFKLQPCRWVGRTLHKLVALDPALEP